MGRKTLALDVLSSNILSANFSGGSTSSILAAQYGQQNTGLSNLLQSSSSTYIPQNLEFSQDGGNQSLSNLVQAELNLDPSFNLLNNLNGFSSYTNTENLLSAAFSVQQSQFDQLV